MWEEPQKPGVDWIAVRAHYDAGHTKAQCKRRFGFSEWAWHAAVGEARIVPRVSDCPAASDKRRLIAHLRSEGLSYREITQRTGIPKGTIAYHLRRIGRPADDSAARRYDWAAVQLAIDRGQTVNELVETFGFSKSSYHEAVKRGELTPRPTVMPIEDLLVVGRKTGRDHLKSRLLKAGLKTHKCERCGISEWRGVPLRMELHHVNGDPRDNRLENLRFLCPNCHAQTHTWGGRNKKAGEREAGPAAAQDR